VLKRCQLEGSGEARAQNGYTVSIQHHNPNQMLYHYYNRQVIIITLPSAVPNIICWSGGQIRHVTALCWTNLLHIVFLSFLQKTSQCF